MTTLLPEIKALPQWTVEGAFMESSAPLFSNHLSQAPYANVTLVYPLGFELLSSNTISSRVNEVLQRVDALFQKCQEIFSYNPFLSLSFTEFSRNVREVAPNYQWPSVIAKDLQCIENENALFKEGQTASVEQIERCFRALLYLIEDSHKDELRALHNEINNCEADFNQRVKFLEKVNQGIAALQQLMDMAKTEWSKVENPIDKEAMKPVYGQVEGVLSELENFIRNHLRDKFKMQELDFIRESLREFSTPHQREPQNTRVYVPYSTKYKENHMSVVFKELNKLVQLLEKSMGKHQNPCEEMINQIFESMVRQEVLCRELHHKKQCQFFTLVDHPDKPKKVKPIFEGLDLALGDKIAPWADQIVAMREKQIKVGVSKPPESKSFFSRLKEVFKDIITDDFVWDDEASIELIYGDM